MQPQPWPKGCSKFSELARRVWLTCSARELPSQRPLATAGAAVAGSSPTESAPKPALQPLPEPSACAVFAASGAPSSPPSPGVLAWPEEATAPLPWAWVPRRDEAVAAGKSPSPSALRQAARWPPGQIATAAAVASVAQSPPTVLPFRKDGSAVAGSSPTESAPKPALQPLPEPSACAVFAASGAPSSPPSPGVLAWPEEATAPLPWAWVPRRDEAVAAGKSPSPSALRQAAQQAVPQHCRD